MQLGSIVGDGNFEVATKKITPNSYKTIELVKNVYRSKDLGIKDKDPEVLAGHVVSWNGHCFVFRWSNKFCLFLIFVQFFIEFKQQPFFNLQRFLRK